MLTGVYPDPRRRTEGGRWIAVWRFDSTTGPQFVHVPVPGFGMTREEAIEVAEAEPPTSPVRKAS